MKKTRILAALVSLMMVVCALPVMQASAASPALAPSNLGAAVAEVMNTISGSDKFETAMTIGSGVNYTPANLDFTTPDFASSEYLRVLDESVSFGSEGIAFGETQGRVRYAPGASNPIWVNTYKAPCEEKEAAVAEKKAQLETETDETVIATLNAEITALNKEIKNLKFYSQYWGLGAETDGYGVYSFKLGEGGNLTSWLSAVNSYNVAWIDVTPESVVIYSGTANGAATNDAALVTYAAEYAPGTEWNDVLVKNGGAAEPYQVWMKKASDTSFTKVAEAKFLANVTNTQVGESVNYGFNVGFGNDCTNVGKGLTFMGTNANVGYAMGLKGMTENPFYDSLEAIIGKNTASTYAFEFDATTNLANSTGRGGFTADGYKSEEDGLTLIDPADESTKFTFAPFGSYSPLNGTTNWNAETYLPQALYVKAKGNFNLLIAGPKTYGRIDMAVETGKEVRAKTGTSNFSYGVAIQDEWTEYLVVPNDLTIENWISEGGYSLYVKGNKATNGIWTKVKDCAYENPTSGYTAYGFSFSKVTGNIKSVRMLSLTGGVADAETAPASQLIFEEEFDVLPQYSNVTTQGVLDEAGNIVFPTTKSSMDFKLKDVTIPVGGYAEFKVQYDGIAGYRFYDGEKIVSVTQQSDYGTITGGEGFAGTTNNLWRTWRIVRGAEGYSVYSKVEGDDGWYAHSVNVGDANDHKAMVHFNFGIRNGSTPEVEEGILVGESKLAYFKVYGPASNDVLTLIDGNTTKVLKDGDAMVYPEAICARVSVDAGKLLVVSYHDKAIGDIQVIDVATEMTNGSKVLDLTTTGASSIRFFLWDDFGNIECLSDDITLTF